MTQKHIAVIGAGMAGLACASELALSDAAVTVFERARGLGGRLATRRGAGIAFDHGAQFLTARGRPFAGYAARAMRAGGLDDWRPRIAEDDRRFEAPIDEWKVGLPGMSGAVRPLAQGLDIRAGVAVHDLFREDGRWILQTDAGRWPQRFDAVAVAVPAPQALSLLGPHGRSFHQLTGVGFTPCWTLMAAFERTFDADAEVIRRTQGAIGWAANDSSKPGREQHAACWVVHASGDWSREHLEASPEDIAASLLREFAELLGKDLPTPLSLTAHRWRYAFVDRPLAQACVVDEEIGAGACGDWCIAPRVEAAFDSGRALAHSLLPMLGLRASVTRRR
jgi:predicted NAD/FAD-dependent oxidoreductase